MFGFPSLRHATFRKLFVGQIFADIGNWLDYIAVTVIVAFHWNLGPTYVAITLMASSLPWIVLGPLVSVKLDRMTPRTVLLVCLLSRIPIIAAMIWAPSFMVLLPLVLLKASLGAVFDPVRQKSIRLYVPEEDLPDAVALGQVAANVSKIAGPMIGGALITIAGSRMPFIVEGVAFIFSILFIMQLPRKASEDNEEQPSDMTFFASLKEGFTHIRMSSKLAAAYLMLGICMTIVFLYDGLFSIWAKEAGFTEGGLGVLISAVGFGSVTGAFLIGKWKIWRNAPLMFMCATVLMDGSIVVLFGVGGVLHLNWPIWIWISLSFLLGIGGAAFSIPFGYIMQSETPARLMGRVSASANAIQSGAMLGAPLIGSALAAWLSLGGVFLLSGLLSMLTAVAGFVLFRSGVRAGVYEKDTSA